MKTLILIFSITILGGSSYSQEVIEHPSSAMWIEGRYNLVFGGVEGLYLKKGDKIKIYEAVNGYWELLKEFTYNGTYAKFALSGKAFGYSVNQGEVIKMEMPQKERIKIED